MTYDRDLLQRILDKTSGKCHICRRQLSLRGYGTRWHVDHSVPRAAGGTDHLNNLYAACVGCNCMKRDGSNRSARSVYGNIRAPLSKSRHSNKVAGNTIVGGCVGALAGAAVLGPPGFWLGLLVGALTGNEVAVDA
jgi:5-methylcytosine-specific restriction endonuclease McrA